MKTMLPYLFALGTALCWGLYGPTLGKARLADTDLSPFKPYVGIGVAYLVIAIAGGLIGMWYKGDDFASVGSGAVWGVAAGTLGALGAFSLTLCMFNGGAQIPHLVMPVVFGGSVTVTALYTVWGSGGEVRASPMLWVGIIGVFVSVIIVTLNTPHASPGRAPQSAPSSSVGEQAPMARPSP